ncbi:hypothetical protein [Nonomuraea sp. NEAU-A123]|uniref:hypothetical protein n=1 Tax=Nonomuraea sp. NEAU-A123 TaxID=2839649 RepID=UPI001BE4BDFC|nr:hypothetical protein [Nonomuraea sp. NEAU-A123]MBT2234415.1 hypothetical protein [Nonomuraea sp. NEAU-A123]
MSVLYIHAPNVSEAWLQAVRALGQRRPEPRALHMIVSIDAPVAEDKHIRAAVDRLLDDLRQPGVDTVANTIFPAAIAATSSNHKELVERYLRYLPRLRGFKGNQFGTYFARLVAYPGIKGAVDQLAAVVDRLQKGGRARFTRYEALIDQPEVDGAPDTDTTAPQEPGELTNDFSLLPDDGATAPIYVPGKDRTPGHFPCLSHCSFQLDADAQVHMLAYYRSQSMVERAYGNYLGLGRLLQYVASQAGLRTGQLTVVAGQAQIEMARRQVRLLTSQPEIIPGFAG